MSSHCVAITLYQKLGDFSAVLYIYICIYINNTALSWNSWGLTKCFCSYCLCRITWRSKDSLWWERDLCKQHDCTCEFKGKKLFFLVELFKLCSPNRVLPAFSVFIIIFQFSLFLIDKKVKELHEICLVYLVSWRQSTSVSFTDTVKEVPAIRAQEHLLCDSMWALAFTEIFRVLLVKLSKN